MGARGRLLLTAYRGRSRRSLAGHEDLQVVGQWRAVQNAEECAFFIRMCQKTLRPLHARSSTSTLSLPAVSTTEWAINRYDVLVSGSSSASSS